MAIRMKSLGLMATGLVAIGAILAAPAPGSAEELLKIDKQATSDGKQLTITRLPFSKRSPPSDKPFSRIEAGDIGIYRPIEFSMKDLWPPFWEGRGTASGDFDNDGDDDIALASTDRGLSLFWNDGKGKFTAGADFPANIRSLPIFNVASVDLNNDGWLDLVFTTYQLGNFVLWNDKGQFQRLQQIKNRPDAVLTQALAFGDVDKDGDLDIVFGNWSSGWYRRVPGLESTNRIVFNDAGIITGDHAQELDGMPGETLSVLLSDFNLDGNLDLIEANDFDQPDIFSLGDGKGNFHRIKAADGIIPVTTTTSMSVKTADLDNDLLPEIYISQIAGRADGISDKLKLRPLAEYCDAIRHSGDKRRCQENIDTKKWYKLGGRQVELADAFNCAQRDKVFEAECKAMMIKDVAIQKNDRSICGYIKSSQARARQLCEVHFRPSIQPSPAEYAENIPQIKGWNVLLVNKGNGTFEDQAKKWNLDIGGWSWDVKMADFDLDGLQDVYITNGQWIINDQIPPNLFYHNLGNRKFEEVSHAFGVDEYLILPAVTTIDIDNDGDLDMIGQAVNGPVMAYINNTQNGNPIAFALEDHAGNRFGIGARIVIHYGPNGEMKQMRELQAGGGFESSDAPKIYFGLGEEKQITKLEIFWPTGEKSEITTPLAAGALYRIVRGEKDQS
jgi:hypothetical protein